MLEKYLQEIGLNEKEAAVYLALLQYDNAAVIDIASKTKINRSTTYTVLESLAKKGLVSETTVGKKTRYQAESPERLETFVERQKVILDEHSKRLKDIIPQIKSVQRESGEKPLVQYFEGKEGVASMNVDLFKDSGEGDSACLVYPMDLLDETFPPEQRSSFKKIRLQKKIFNKVLYTSDKTVKPSDETGERIKIDQSKYPIYCDISIFKDRVRIGILGKRISGIYIKSKDFAETLRSLFSIAFDSLHDKK
jgi:sugar-specific transcriptional regulator TrmB